MHTGAVEVRDGNIVALCSDAYVPKREAAENLQILAEDPPELTETILQNTFGDSNGPQDTVCRLSPASPCPPIGDV